MSTITLIRGVPGSGKSTLAKAMVTAVSGDMCHYEADMYFINADHEYVFDRTALGRAHEWCLNKTTMCMESGHDVVVSNTFIKLWEMDKYLDLASRHDYQVKVINATCGNGVSIHGVPDEVIERMRGSWEEFK